LGLADARVDSLRKSGSHLNLLRRYRNGVFHFQKDYLDDRFVELMKSGMASVVWIREFHDALGEFFLQWMRNEKAKRKR
jgi:hypothetical protein